MMFPVLRGTFLLAWLSVLLLSLLGGRGCDTLPLSQKHPPRVIRSDPGNPGITEAAQELDALEQAADAQDGGELHPALKEVVGRLVGITTDTRTSGADDPKRSRRLWGTPQPAADQMNLGYTYVNYEHSQWGDYLSVSSSSEAGTDSLDNYDQLGGGKFISEVIDPSVTHTVYGSLPSVHDGSDTGVDDSKWTAALPVGVLDFKTFPQPSDKGAGRPTSQLLGSGMAQNTQDPSQEPGEDLIAGEAVDSSRNALDRHSIRQEDSSVGNLLSSVLSADDGDSLAHNDLGKSFLATPSDSAEKSEDTNGVERVASAVVAVKSDEDAISDQFAVEKAVGTLCLGTSKDRSQADMTEDDIIDDFLDWLFSFLNDVVLGKEKLPVRKLCS
ncbi:uncharacterized protein LOC110988956 [Acanthaster planci]|uniref:Uncharacterized protein LOC110988956 n=1 Tax=Acanthaster planci TaxID=133434 RepID=A0A8B7ZUA2_ACAPL|nr:uncharacterized protein LOC110988956 [Acanthaster planci]